MREEPLRRSGMRSFVAFIICFLLSEIGPDLDRGEAASAEMNHAASRTGIDDNGGDYLVLTIFFLGE